MALHNRTIEECEIASAVKGKHRAFMTVKAFTHTKYTKIFRPKSRRPRQPLTV